jgi:hypothetical protein
MAKARVASRVKSAVGGKSLNESQDLVKLTDSYNAFAKRLQALVAALKEHFKCMNALANSRHLVRRNLRASQYITISGALVVDKLCLCFRQMDALTISILVIH